MHAYVLVNRRARRLATAGALLSELHRPRRGVRVVETRSQDELDAAAAIIAAGAPVAAVVLAGGDGSYMAGVSALARAFGERPLPPIALAPGGTVGTIARNWGLTGDPVRAARHLLDSVAVRSFRSVRRPTLRVRDEDAVRVGFIVGAGLVTRFFEIYDARGATGTLDAARITLRVFTGSFVGSRFARAVLDPTRCALEVDGQLTPFDRASLLCASVVKNLGLGMRLVYRAGEELDCFHVIATPLPARALGPQMPRVLAGRPLRGPRVDTLARSLRVRFPDRDGGYVLDGDLFRANELDVHAGPVLDVVDPRSEAGTR